MYLIMGIYEWNLYIYVTVWYTYNDIFEYITGIYKYISGIYRYITAPDRIMEKKNVSIYRRRLSMIEKLRTCFFP